MTASTKPAPAPRPPIRLELADDPASGSLDGAWWPRSRALPAEVADLVDHFPTSVGHINRLLFSRPDWDDCVADGRGVRVVLVARGRVKVGSFPSDDTHLMIATLASGRRLRLLVIPSAMDSTEGERLLAGAGALGSPPRHDAANRWDDEVS
jgi:hypothetical protein